MDLYSFDSKKLSQSISETLIAKLGYSKLRPNPARYINVTQLSLVINFRPPTP